MTSPLAENFVQIPRVHSPRQILNQPLYNRQIKSFERSTRFGGWNRLPDISCERLSRLILHYGVACQGSPALSTYSNPFVKPFHNHIPRTRILYTLEGDSRKANSSKTGCEIIISNSIMGLFDSVRLRVEDVLWMLLHCGCYIDAIGFVIFVYQVIFFHCIRFDSVSGYISPFPHLSLHVFCVGVHVATFSVCFLCYGYSHLLALNICSCTYVFII